MGGVEGDVAREPVRIFSQTFYIFPSNHSYHITGKGSSHPWVIPFSL